MKPSIKELQFYSDIGIAYAKNKQFKKAFEAFTEYEKLYPNSGRAFSNWIIYFALQDEKEALSNLQKAIDLGFDDLEWLENEDSLNSLRKETEFIKLLEKLKMKK